MAVGVVAGNAGEQRPGGHPLGIHAERRYVDFELTYGFSEQPRGRQPSLGDEIAQSHCSSRLATRQHRSEPRPPRGTGPHGLPASWDLINGQLASPAGANRAPPERLAGVSAGRGPLLAWR